MSPYFNLIMRSSGKKYISNFTSNDMDYNNLDSKDVNNINIINKEVSTYNNLAKYKAINNFDKVNITKVYKYLSNNKDKLDDNEVNILKLLETRVVNNDFIKGYILKDSFVNLDYLNKLDTELNGEDDSLDYDYGINNINEYKVRFTNILNSLDEKRIYKIIFRWESIDVNEHGRKSSNFNTSPSFFIHKDTDIEVVLYKFVNYLNNFVVKYSVSDNLNLDIFVKEWISISEFKSLDNIIDVINKGDKEFKYSQIIDKNKELNKNNYFDTDLIKTRKNNLAFLIKPDFADSIKVVDKELKINYFNTFNIPHQDLDKFEFYHFFLRNNKKILIKVEKFNNYNLVRVYSHAIVEHINELHKLELESWKDKVNVNNTAEIEREIINSGYHIYFVNNNIIKIEVKFNSKVLQESYYDREEDIKIGAMDIETYNNELDQAIPYAIGFKDLDNLSTFYIDNYNNPEDMILDCIHNMMVKDNHNMKFYAHNMSQFDGILILKALMSAAKKHDYKFKVFSNNEGKIISIDILKILPQKKTIKISILDSCLILPVNLNKLAKVFNSEVRKGIFPYDFLNMDTLLYEGDVPDFKYFNNINLLDYKDYVKSFNNGNWNAKIETIKYLEKDILSLYEVVNNFNNIIFNKFNINITRIRTISGLAFLIFTAKYYDPNKTPIYFTKGKLEKYIRSAYYGGIVDVVLNYTDFNSYKYDVNSHYPNAMLKPMPGGIPRITNEKDLDKIFGFVEATVQAPNEQELKVPILPIKLNGRTELFRGIAKGVWWSEELKQSVKEFGYKVHQIHSCIEFDRVEGTFNNYINDIFEFKKQADIQKNEVERLINKLLLNSLYGRLGLKDQNVKLSIVEDKKLDKILHTENSEVLFNNNNLNLVKSNGPLDPEITRIINEEKLYTQKMEFNQANPWGKNTSSVQYSAAITAYARMELNKFKNIKENLYIGGDTDSIIMSKPIDDKYIGLNLGQFKLEHIITEGLYHSKKFYFIRTNDGKTIIKAKGIDNSKNILSYYSFVELFKGNTLTIKQLQFNKNYKTLDISIKYIEKNIKGIKDPKINEIFLKKK
uniref:Probable DNA polymerase n=1 Tax=Lyophyllum shimeji TaxID=47721 RepID=A0A8F1ACZ5_LYOSH|nr:DNA polymerase [Lyophyllum shimeji]